MGKKSKFCPCCSTLVLGISLTFVGVVLACLNFGAMPLYKSLVQKKLVMTQDSTTFKDWNHAPLPVYMNYYVFNYTNVDEILNGSKPNVQELGPYAYREERNNLVLEMNSDDITYNQTYAYVFDANMSCKGCSESDTFFTPNAPLLTVLRILEGAHVTNQSSSDKINYMRFFDNILKAALKGTGSAMFYHHNVTQLLWGYEDEFLAGLQAQLPGLPPTILTTLNITFPKHMDTFVALQHNGTSEAKFFGNFTIKTGNENIDDLQRVTKWRGSNEVPCWLDEYGRMINGTDGTHFKPFVTKDDTLYTFIPDICRSLYLEYDKEDSIQDIDLHRYTTPQNMLLNATANPNNKAFCVGGCWPTGIMPIGQCQDGDPPAFASGAHFYQSDPSLFQAIDGLDEPNKEKHATLISVEPDTGTTMKANKRIQINLRATKVPYLTLTDGFPDGGIFLPILLVDESVRIDKKNADTFQDEVGTPKKYLVIFRYVLVGVGCFLVLIGLAIYIVNFIKESNVRKGYKKTDM